MSTPRSLVPLAAMIWRLASCSGAQPPWVRRRGTESGVSFPITPDPADCQVEPRATEELLALWYTPGGQPGPGSHADDGRHLVGVPLGPRADGPRPPP